MNHLKTGNAFFGQGNYKNYKYNGKELQETGMYDYGARMYMSDLGRWGVVDPLAEKYQSMSVYHMSGNNPIFYIDSNGMNYDDYGVDQNGNVNLIQKTEDNFDRLYVSKSDNRGNAILDNSGNAQKVIDGIGKENRDFVKIDKANSSDGTLISQLGTNVNGKERYGTTTNGIDARKVFQFGAENTDVEWSIGGFDTKGSGMADKYLVGTSGMADKVTAPWNFGEKGLTFDNVKYAGHTHPFTRMPQPHDVGISNPDAYNFIYYTGAGSNVRENHFVPFRIIEDNKTGEKIPVAKSNARQIKLPVLIP